MFKTMVAYLHAPRCVSAIKIKSQSGSDYDLIPSQPSGIFQTLLIK